MTRLTDEVRKLFDGRALPPSRTTRTACSSMSYRTSTADKITTSWPS